MTFEAARAHEYYQRAWAALPAVDARRLFAAEIMGRTYFALLRAIEARRFDVFDRRVTLSTPRRLAIALRVLARRPPDHLVKAAVCDAGAIELRDWPEPAPGPGELLLRVSGCGLCGSDILKINAAAPGPTVLGHEVVGQVADVGRGRAALRARRPARGRSSRAVLSAATTAGAAARPCAATSSESISIRAASRSWCACPRPTWSTPPSACPPT